MKLVGIALLVMGLAALVFTVPAEKVANEGDTRVFEFSVYHAAPGKMDAQIGRASCRERV